MDSISSVVVGVDFGQTSFKGALVTREGRMTGLKHTASNLHSQPEALLESIAHFVQGLMEDARQNHLPMEGIGISSTVDVNAAQGRLRVVNQNQLTCWQDFPLAQTLEERFGLPVLVENDGIAAAWGEYKMGAGQPFQNVVSITLGTGLGGGIILDGKLHPDTLGAASYFGHMCIDRHGEWCTCGHRGCWELYVSATALERRLGEALRESTIPTSLTNHSRSKEIVIAAQNQDILAVQLLDEIGAMLGLGLVSLANIINPEVIVVGGGLATAGDLILNPARQVFSRQRMLIRKDIPIRATSLGLYSGVLGASLLCFEHLSKGLTRNNEVRRW